MTGNASKLAIYVAAIVAFVALAQIASDYFLGFWLGGLGTPVALYTATIFDLRVANSEWAIGRRILPNVSAWDCAVLALPHAVGIAFVVFKPESIMFVILGNTVILFSGGNC
ncbi:MAG: hypothetical protein IV086_13645 [Hyphomonadaceae bacterium]|nr:hypothetical protein [Hyphomonadaceae bacterium]